ncbi:hypothetical protein HBI56_230750 [Parastagonospora nodorum]|uniref:Uncharacterized protein n=2 Tax=Phaeosphaeria nodorum (strain SN15 / ATCC MYA-4574 / FGSC 10173) TaxID=321614 RepID=A0A7U2FJ94_PHANO|nr:hypothetical protein SNOG_16131 [Parastagonospora nodorum SN15]KAH3905089.1 hypothetical protein HBH56_223690 [Parastagonospora nodorum]EAT76503.1 hypothetical protein SNOG_16131 [Parastagonospora nodorum SN15]KAH3921880.1 hypothetical protein HBH54_231840 [Parastagonospora nodorum]KAH3939398.1 hypothetical protein HBH53_234960 [Parastagonospora nodorum]KAH3957250.1 hypothetical protein HBH51_228330 [Parastagonospora nodorum]
MKFTLAAAALFVSMAFAAPAPQNAGRPVPTGNCCAPNASLKQDVCNVNGSTGRCVPSGSRGCGGALTCIEDARLTCDANTLERGRPLCRLAGEGI